jgi:uncharacterized membrane protein YfcA
MIGYLLALLIGVVLGLLGGGGAILMVPVMVYVMGIEPVIASANSLFVVGLSSLAGAIPYYRSRQIEWSVLWLYGLCSLLAVFLTRWLLVPALPDPLLNVGGWHLQKSSGLMLLFALVMLQSARSMLKSVNANPNTANATYPGPWLIALVATGEGLLSGLVGAGGGFIIIPALVLLARVEMKKAVGTSLVIIGIKSLIGFLGDALQVEWDWRLLALLSLFTATGTLIGYLFSSKVNASSLKKAFGWLVLAMGVFVLLKELMR